MDFALQTSQDKAKNSESLDAILTAAKDDFHITDLQKTAIRGFFRHLPELALNIVCDLSTKQSINRTRALTASPISEDLDSAITHVPKELLICWCNEKPQARYPFAAQHCKLLKDSSAEKNFSLSEIALAVLESAPDKKPVLEELVERFFPYSYVGSYANALESRLSLFDQLKFSQDPQLSSLINERQNNFKELIQKEKTKERNEGQRKNTSFE